MPKKGKKSEAYAVLGYISDDIAKSLGTQGSGKALELRVERGSDSDVVRIEPDAVAGILYGPSQGGETSVQVLLKDKGSVETLSRGIAADLHLKLIRDPSLVIKRLPINVIFVDPLLTDRLTELAKSGG